MRLLDTYSGQFVEKDPSDIEYAILSHTWNHEGEQTYHDLRRVQARFTCSGPPPCHPHEYPQIPPSSFDKPLSLGSSLPSPPSFNSSQPSEPIPSERTPLLHMPASLDSVTEQGLPPGHHCKISRFRRLQLLIVRSSQWVWRLVALLTCGLRRRPTNLDVGDRSPDAFQTLSPQSSTQIATNASPSTIPRCLSPSGLLEPCREGEASKGEDEAVLSPLWGAPELSPKVREACAVARANGFRFIWVDACCIDRSSSSELSEAITSMYSWYASAAVCYAHLADVPIEDDHRAQDSCFRESRWFMRGWTLPELVAPRDVIFLSQDWQVIGTKSGLADLVEEITGVSREAFLHLKPLAEFSLAQRLSWASQRETMLVEDEAYSLLGIFGVDMPIRYGEGEPAFRRLQEEIMSRVPDHSLFAWGDVYTGSEPDPGLFSSTPAAGGKQQTYLCRAYNNHNYRALLATSPSMVEDSARSITVASRDVLRRLELSHPDTFECVPSPHGFRMPFQVIPLSQYFPPCSMSYDSPDMAHWQWYLAILACEHEDRPGNLLGRVCYIPPSHESGLELLRPGYVHISPRPERGGGAPDLFPLSSETIARCRPYIETKTVYI
ncbi:hypothetical protein V8D89_000306 [Ganoderma adspersum]